MKSFKIVLLVLAIMMVCAVIIGCTSDKDTEETTTVKATTTPKVTTTKETTTTPEPLAPEVPVTGDEFAAWEDTLSKVDIVDATVDGLNAWGDGKIEYVYDGTDGYHDHQGLVKGDEGWNDILKVGGQVSGTSVIITISLEAKAKIENYALFTGKDCVEWTGRTPTAWVLYATNTNPDEATEADWTLLHQVDDAGIDGEYDSTPFGYSIPADKVGEYQYYRFEFTAVTGGITGGVFQLNEIILYTKKA